MFYAPEDEDVLAYIDTVEYISPTLYGTVKMRVDRQGKGLPQTKQIDTALISFNYGFNGTVRTCSSGLVKEVVQTIFIYLILP